MSEVVERFWAAMQRNDWADAAAQFVEGIEIDWPCSGERIVGRADFVAVQERYPHHHRPVALRGPPTDR